MASFSYLMKMAKQCIRRNYYSRIKFTSPLPFKSKIAITSVSFVSDSLLFSRRRKTTLSGQQNRQTEQSKPFYNNTQSLTTNDSESKNKDSSFNSLWNNLSVTQKSWAIIGSTGIVIGISAVVATPGVLALTGFSAGGVTKASLAAYVHSLIGNVSSGSVFAGAQSVGATGAVSTVTTTVGGLGAVGGAIISWIGLGSKDNSDDKNDK
eukprot:343341_1